MKRACIWILLMLILLTACGQNKGNDQEAEYMNITAEEAKHIMDDTEVVKLLRESLEDYELPKQFIFVEHLPRNESGKIDKLVDRKSVV